MIAEHDLLAQWLILATLLVLFSIAHSYYVAVPSLSEADGWGSWWDQSKYIDAARAWSRFDVTASHHWYPPGYSLLAAPFLGIITTDRFFIPNLACLAVCQFGCAALARRLFPTWRFASLCGAFAFIVTTAGSLLALKSWLTPWTTTPAAAVTIIAFVAALRLVERPGFWRASITGAAIGSIALFRPSDAVPVAMAVTLLLVPLLLRLELSKTLTVVGGCLIGGVAVSLVLIALIAETSGVGTATYYELSSKIGFEFGLVPLRWVTLVISGNPIFDGVGTQAKLPRLHAGLIEAFPWMIFGVGGIAASLASGRARGIHVMLAAWLGMHIVLLLAYRDLHILGLWLYGNYHYFKVTQPIFMLFAVVLVFCVADRTIRARSIVAASVSIFLLFGWRASLVPVSTSSGVVVANSMMLPALDHLQDAVVIGGRGTWNELYTGQHDILIGKNRVRGLFDFRIYGRDHDMIIVPLRRLVQGPGLITRAAELGIQQDAVVILAHQTITFGIPCAFNLAGSSICGVLGSPLLQ